MRGAKDAYGTYELARLLRVSPSTVGRWIEDGRLPSFMTLGRRRRVWRKDAAELVRRLGMPVPPELAEAPRILIVDDEKGLRDFLSFSCKELFPGAELHEAENGFEAGRKAAELRPSLVILDLNLPGIDGLQILRAIRGDPALKGIKVLAITGLATEKMRELSLDAGADAFLGKPVEWEPLSSCLKRLMTGVTA